MRLMGSSMRCFKPRTQFTAPERGALLVGAVGRSFCALKISLTMCTCHTNNSITVSPHTMCHSPRPGATLRTVA
jgi:hypothetical protein